VDTYLRALNQCFLGSSGRLAASNREFLRWYTGFGSLKRTLYGESSALCVPCLTISEGTNLRIGTDPFKIVAAARDTLTGMRKAGRIPPFWDGHAAKRLVDILLQEVPRGIAS